LIEGRGPAKNHKLIVLGDDDIHVVPAMHRRCGR
jgi:predicted methyltransferase